MSFPYYFCTSDSTQTVICANDPYNLKPPNNHNLVPYRRPDANVCFTMANVFNTGEISDGFATVQVTSSVNWQVGSTGIGVSNIFDREDAGGDPTYWSPLESGWVSQWASCTGVTVTHSSCCVGLYFEDNPKFWDDQGFYVDSTPQNTNANMPLGYVMTHWNDNCVDDCQPDNELVYLNVTNQFFYASNSFTEPSDPYGADPWQKSYVIRTYDFYNSIGQTHLPSLGPYGIQTAQQYDFMSIFYHEWGHLLGLPHRDTLGSCGNPDPNSIMNSALKSGTVRNTMTNEDCCWLRKLYYPFQFDTCPGYVSSSVGEVDPGSIDLEQSQPNPTTGAAEIGFTTDREMLISIDVFDILGKKILTLANQQLVSTGHHTVSITAGVLPSGKYIYSLRAGDAVLSKMMTVEK
jgi:hypothetical protein